MDPQKFGDSYDIVKREIIHGLAPPEHWAVHPMYFLPPWKPNFLDQYKEYLGIRVADHHTCERERVGEIGALCPTHLFLDPDTGLWVQNVGGVTNENPPNRKRKHITVRELVEIARTPSRSHKLTLVFDQSYTNAYNNLRVRKEAVREKLNMLPNDIYSVAYVSHAVFIWVSATKSTVVGATRRFRVKSKIPVGRFITDEHSFGALLPGPY